MDKQTITHKHYISANYFKKFLLKAVLRSKQAHQLSFSSISLIFIFFNLSAKKKEIVEEMITQMINEIKKGVYELFVSVKIVDRVSLNTFLVKDDISRDKI